MKINDGVKKIMQMGAAIGVGGGVIVTVLVFSLDAYIGGVVDVKMRPKLEAVPTTIGLDAHLLIIRDGINSNAAAIDKVSENQQRFELLFIDYLQNEANR